MEFERELNHELERKLELGQENQNQSQNQSQNQNQNQRKALNPNLFAERAVTNLDLNMAGSDQNIEIGSSALGHQLNHLEGRFVESRKEMFALQEHLANVVEQFNQFIRGNQSKLEKINQAVSTLETKENNHQAEMAQKMASLQMRLQERRMLDSKIQELVDRHQGVLRTYDVRLSQMQKLLAEKETQLLQSQAALNEAKMEISRLKRM